MNTMIAAQNTRRTKSQARGANQPSAELDGLSDLVAEQIPDGDECPGPEERARGIEEEEGGKAHPEHARERSRGNLQPRNELGDEHRGGLPPPKEGLRALDARVRLQRDAAEQGEDAAAVPAAELVPDQIGGDQREERAGNGDGERELSRASQYSGREQDRRSGHRQAQPTGEDQADEDQGPMPRQESLHVVHPTL